MFLEVAIFGFKQHLHVFLPSWRFSIAVGRLVAEDLHCLWSTHEPKLHHWPWDVLYHQSFNPVMNHSTSQLWTGKEIALVYCYIHILLCSNFNKMSYRPWGLWLIRSMINHKHPCNQSAMCLHSCFRRFMSLVLSWKLCTISQSDWIMDVSRLCTNCWSKMDRQNENISA